MTNAEIEHMTPETYVENVGNGSVNPPRNPATTNGAGGGEDFAADPSTSHKPRWEPVDMNLYATKKTIAQGMMDFALLMSNAGQLRSALETRRYREEWTYYYLNIVLISISILLQVVIGIMLIFIGRYNVVKDNHAEKADKLHNRVVAGVFLITVVNMFITAFTEGDFGYPEKINASLSSNSSSSDIIERS